jgi:hypothetical protein
MELLQNRDNRSGIVLNSKKECFGGHVGTHNESDYIIARRDRQENCPTRGMFHSLGMGPSGNTRYNWLRRFWSEPRSEERAYREYGSDERGRRSPKVPRPYGEAHLWPGASLFPRSHSSAMLPRCASPRSQIRASQLYRLCPDGPYVKFRSYPDRIRPHGY